MSAILTRNAAGSTPPFDGAEAEIGVITGCMSEDRSNDWSEEVQTLTALEAEITSVRIELEHYRNAFGPVDEIETAKNYTRLGEYAAAALGSNTQWPGAEPLEWIAERWGTLSPIAIGGQTPEGLVHWRAIADRLGIEHDGEPAEYCSVEDCDGLVPDDMLTDVCPQHEPDDELDVATTSTASVLTT